jgi:hypothetical protein
MLEVPGQALKPMEGYSQTNNAVPFSFESTSLAKLFSEEEIVIGK